VDVRVIASSNRSLKQMVEEQTFRQDLYYRLNVITITLPPIRDREGDALLLARHFIDEFNGLFGKSIKGLTPDAERLIARYRWPGNVRELKHLIERAMILEEGPEIGESAFPVEMAETPDHGKNVALPDISLPENGTSLERVEEELVRQALARTRGNQTRAAQLLDISRDSLRYKMKKFHLEETVD
jgi:transcriptional regulator with PAS, ATPase and Fis domain